MDIVIAVRQALSVLNIISHISIIIFFIILALKNKIRLFRDILRVARKYSLQLSFTVALTATLGSLFFSEIAMYEPCKLCWFQRIFMYPLSILLGLGLLKKDRNIFSYAIPLAIIGGSISAYHYTTNLLNKLDTAVSSGICTATGPSCLFEYFTEYGYITLPLMALTAFILIIISGFLGKSR